MDEISEIDARIRELTLKLEQLRVNLPSHSVKPEMLTAIQRTEEEIADLRQMRREVKRQKEEIEK
ncbi:MAG: hypothetical protein ACE5QW_09625 [Thermoplasmata archaeon]